MITAPLPDGGLSIVPVGLDYGAVLAMGDARGVDMALLSDLLPSAEAAILSSNREIEDD